MTLAEPANPGMLRNMAMISSVRAREILDSRGNPTLRVYVELDSGLIAAASVPSGASTGANEAVELRDGDKGRYGGKGVRIALGHVNDTIAKALVRRDPTDQRSIDQLLIDLDGTANKSRLGANATVGVSMAVAGVAAKQLGIPLYRHLGGRGARLLPMPMMNIINGGKHAANSVDFQEFMIVPVGAMTFSEALRFGVETFHALAGVLEAKGYATTVGDEGGFAPNLRSNEEACELILAAIEHAGFEAGTDIAIAIDPAASSFFRDGKYHLTRSGEGIKSTDEMIALYDGWLERYPIVSIEDGLDEGDWDGFAKQTARQGDRVQIVGDDIFVTNPTFVQRGIESNTANAALIKLNQIGTVTETIKAVDLCRKAGWGFVISHRSGETEDTFMADFTVAMGGGQIKTGSVCRGERTAKYNRLLEIEAELGAEALFTPGVAPSCGNRRSEP